jgi:hypothetical protein
MSAHELSLIREEREAIALGAAARVARRVFESRVRAGRRNVEVHLSEAELVAAIAAGAELALLATPAALAQPSQAQESVRTLARDWRDGGRGNALADALGRALQCLQDAADIDAELVDERRELARSSAPAGAAPARSRQLAAAAAPAGARQLASSSSRARSDRGEVGR